MTGDWRKLHVGEFHNLYGRDEKCLNMVVGNPEGERRFGRLHTQVEG